MMVIGELAFTCRTCWGGTKTRPFEMLAGLSYKSTEPAHRLADLRRWRPTGRRSCSSSRPWDETTADRLSETDAEFAEASVAYQRQYACRVIGYGAADLTIAETPSLTLRLIRHQRARAYDPKAEATELERKRARVIAEAWALLADHTPAERERFDAGWPARSAPIPYGRTTSSSRSALPQPSCAISCLSRAAGWPSAARSRSGTTPSSSIRLTTRWPFYARGARHNVVRRGRGRTPLGPGQPGPAQLRQRPRSTAVFKAFPPEARFAHEALMWVIDRMGMPPLEMGESNVRDGGSLVQGIPASGGRYTGTGAHRHGRVGVTQAGGRRRPGLSCHVSRVVLFPSVGALVTDTGGVLSHPAIIAREYLVPTVVSTGNATWPLRDGQIVTVDGAAGRVEVRDG